MTLYQLGEEYAETEKKLRERIKVLRTQCAGKSAEERKKLKTRIWQLIYDAYDCRRISDHLIHYYDERNGESNGK